MTAKVRVLLYEDDGEQAKTMAAALHAASPTGVRLEVVWIADFIAPSRTKGHAVPLVVSDAPHATLLEGDGASRSLGETKWWPSSFTAAFLDVYKGRGESPIGENLAIWLQDARFHGPVVLASAYDIATDTFPFLPDLHTESKREEGWEQRGAERIMRSIRSLPGAGVLVGLLGRDPDEHHGALDGFWGGFAEVKAVSPWRAGWIGTDLAIADSVLKFCRQGRVELEEIVTDAQWPERIASLVTSMSRRPNIIWWDHDDLPLTGQVVRIIERIREATARVVAEWSARKQQARPTDRATTSAHRIDYPLIVLLADRIQGLTPVEERRLLVNGAVVVHRTTIAASPFKWAADAAERFVSRHNLLVYTEAQLREMQAPQRQRNAKAVRTILTPTLPDARSLYCERVERLYRAHLELLAVARKRTNIAHSRASTPSILNWIAASPFASGQIKTSYDRNASRWWRDLREWWPSVHPHAFPTVVATDRLH